MTEFNRVHVLVTNTAGKVSKYEVISGPYFPVFIQSEYRKIRTRNNSVFGHISRSESPYSIRIQENTDQK